MQVREAGSVDHRQLSLDLHPRYTAIASRSLTINCVATRKVQQCPAASFLRPAYDMSAEILFLIAFFAVVVLIILLVFAALMFEADGDLPAPEQETAETGDEPDQTTAGAGRKSA
jgi:hypothetical protein